MSEKFFALVEIFGAENVGMVTGDSIGQRRRRRSSAAPPRSSPTSPSATAPTLPVDQVVMDEFHFYADPDRGWAWQVPLLTLPRVQFLLMSATLGDVQRASPTT